MYYRKIKSLQGLIFDSRGEQGTQGSGWLVVWFEPGGPWPLPCIEASLPVIDRDPVVIYKKRDPASEEDLDRYRSLSLSLMAAAKSSSFCFTMSSATNFCYNQYFFHC